MNNQRFRLIGVASCWVGAIAPALTCQFAPVLTCQFATPAHAQIIPDGTLSTSVTSSDNQNFVIVSGDRNGNNLFHSFDTFSIPTSGSAIFNNPIDIENILSRVTGPSFSNIDGLLQTTGTTNLFLLNPNGIIFGPNAQLDIAGSFTASTADSLTFADGSEFSATAAESALLSISVPVGLQLNNPPQGDIKSLGHLETGQDMTLLGQNLYLEGDLMAGQNLTLQAQDTVIMRDTLTRSGNDLTIQGGQGVDIFALNRLAPFVSDGNLTLISDGDISADAHFKSGGDLRFLDLAGAPGSIISLHDPIILANGDVVLGDYTGVALKVEAQGSIDAGDIVITGPDTTLSADGSGSDIDLLASSRAAILRAGVNADPGQPLGSITVSTINTSDVTGGDGGPIILEAVGDITTTGFFLGPQGEPITLGSFSFSEGSDSGNGGAINLSSVSGDIALRGNRQSNRPDNVPSPGPGLRPVTVGSFSLSVQKDSGKGGPISIAAGSGSIEVVGNLNTQSFAFQGFDLSVPAGNSGNAGDITITSNIGDISVEGTLNASAGSNAVLSPSGNSGDGGNITLSSTSGNIWLLNEDSSILDTSTVSLGGNAFAGNSGNGGIITVSSTTGDILAEGFFVQSDSRTSSLSFTTPTSSGNSGNGGDIIFSSTSGNITINSIMSSSSRSDAASSVFASAGISGDGGNISITSDSGTIILNPPKWLLLYPEFAGTISASISSARLVSLTGSIPSSATAFPGDSGNGGDITFSSNSGDIIINAPLTSSSSSQSNSDNVSDSSQSNSDNVSDSGNAAGGGGITLSTRSGDIQLNQDLSSLSLSTSGTAGRGGGISLSSREGAVIGNDRSLFVFSIGERPEATGAGGSVILQANQAISGLEILTLANTGSSGNVDIQGLGDHLMVSDLALIVALQDSVSSPIGNLQEIALDNETNFTSGQTAIESLGDLTLKNVSIEASANSTEPSGNVTVTSPGQVAVLNSQINSNANNIGQAGSIEVTAERLALTDSIVSATTTGPGRAGDIRFNLSDALSLDDSMLTSSTEPGSTGQGGNIELNAIAPNLETLLQNESQLAVNSEGQGTGGNINLTTQRLTLKEASRINATTLSSDGGNVSLVLGDLLLLRNGSEISTSAGIDGTGGDGGDISVGLVDGVIVALPNENSDITANAFEGNGGNIQITATGIIGLHFQPELTPLSDISASSQFGVDGIVQLDTPELDPNQGLVELPGELIDPSDKISSSCLVTAEDNSLTVSGRGGLPDSPDSSNSSVVWEDWRPLETKDRSATTSTSVESTPLVEATEVVVAANGHVEFITQSEKLLGPHQINCGGLRL